MYDQQLAKQFSALGDKTRYAIVVSMINGEGLCVSQLAEQLNMTPAAISQHLKILEQAGIVVPAREGRRVCCALNQQSESVSQLTELMQRQNTSSAL